MVNFLKLLKNKVFKETAWTIALIVFMLMVFVIVNKALDVANIDSLDITKEYNDYFNADSFGKEKLDLFQDL